MKEQDTSVRLLTARTFALVSQTPTAPELALENVIPDTLANGALCFVQENLAGSSGLYRLSRTATAAVDGFKVLPTGSGVGRWFKLDADGSLLTLVDTLTPFGEVAVPGGTLEAAPVVFTQIDAPAQPEQTLVATATLSMQALEISEGTLSLTAGVKFLWDLDGSGAFATTGARIPAFNVLAGGASLSVVLRDRITITPAQALLGPSVRAVGWDPTALAGYQTADGTPGSACNNLQLQLTYAV